MLFRNALFTIIEIESLYNFLPVRTIKFANGKGSYRLAKMKLLRQKKREIIKQTYTLFMSFCRKDIFDQTISNFKV